MTPVIVAVVWLMVALGTLSLRVRVASGRFAPTADPVVGDQMKQWMSSPFNRWSDVFLSASSLIAAWFARGEAAVAVLALVAGVAFAASAWIGWRTRAGLATQGAAEPREDDGSSPCRLSAVPLGVTGMVFLLASQAIRGAAGEDPNTTAAVALVVTIGVGLVLLVGAAFAAFKTSTEKAQRDYLGRE